MRMIKSGLVLSLSAVLTWGLAGCSQDEDQSYSSESGEGVTAPESDQSSAADVKQPVSEPSKPADEKPVSEVVEEKVETVEEAVKTEVSEAKETVEETVKEEVAEVTGAAQSGSSLYATCIGCHGATGGGGVGPKLAGQPKADLIAKLKQYKAGEQVGPMTAMMAPMASGLSDEEIETVSEYITTF